MVVKVNVLDAQAHTFHHAQPAAVYDLGNEFTYAREVGDEPFNFIFGEHDWNRFGALGAKFGNLEFIELEVKNVSVEEEDGAKGLILSGGGDLLFGCEVGKVLSDFRDAHFFWMAFIMKENVVPDPLDIGVFGARGVMLDAKGIAILVEKFFFWRFLRCGSWNWLGHFLPFW